MESTSSFGDEAETIAALRKEIKDRNKDIHAAATFGKQLLEEKEKLGEKLNALEDENETLKQQKYSLQLDLETKVQTINTQSSELEIQRKQHDSVVKELEVLRKENITNKRQISNFEKERLDFENTREDFQLENQCLKKKLSSLEFHIKGLQMKLEASHDLEVVEESDTEFNIEFYKRQCEKFKEELLKLQYDLESSNASEKRLTNTVKELEEGVRERDKELASYSVEIQKAQDYANELQCEIEILKLEQVDTERRGNSVFGEIDDRRKIIEKEYKLLMKRYENLSKNFKVIKKELVGCKRQMTVLLSMTNRTHEDAYIDKLEGQLRSSKREMEVLVAKLSNLLKEGQQRRKDLALSETGEYNYLRIMNMQAEKRIKNLENELVSVHIQKISDHDYLLEAQREMYAVEKTLDKVNMENMKLRNEIKELTLTIETEVPNVNEDEIVVREFDPNKKTHLKHENIKPKESNSATGLEEKGYSVLSREPPSRVTTVLKDLNEKRTDDQHAKPTTACQTKTSPKDKKAGAKDHLSYLDNIPCKQNVQNFSSRTDRKEGQCAQQ